MYNYSNMGIAPINYATNPFAGVDTTSQVDVFDNFLQNLLSGAYNSASINTNNNIEELDAVYNPEVSGNLARKAMQVANAENTKGWCARGVNDTLQAVGLSEGEIRSASAYQCADKLANSNNFKEVRVSKSDLKNLPAGCIICWDRNQQHQHGHITITLGNGKEASDHVTDLIDLGTDFRVFVPVQNSLSIAA